MPLERDRQLAELARSMTLPILSLPTGCSGWRCVVAADPKHPPMDLAKSLIDEMVENMALVQ